MQRDTLEGRVPWQDHLAEGRLVVDLSTMDTNSNTSQADTTDTHRHPLDKYLEQYHHPVLIPAGRKGPVEEGWQTPKSPDVLRADYRPGMIIGLLQGILDDFLVTVDHDDPVALALAPHFLPATGMLGGKSSTADAHWSYRCLAPPETRRYSHDKCMLVELLSTGTQVVVEGTHPDTGEPYVLTGLGQAQAVDGAQLDAAVRLLATATLLVKTYPGHDSKKRQQLWLALGGFLARRNVAVEDAKLLARVVTEYVGDEESRKRVRAVRDSYRKVASGGKATGLPQVANTISREVAETLSHWWDAQDEMPPEPSTLDAIFEDVEVFKSNDGFLYARVLAGDGITRIVDAPDGLADYAQSEHIERHGKPAPKSALKALVEALASAARYKATEREVFVRVAAVDGVVYLDLDHRAGRVVRIGPDGYQLMPSAPVPFVWRTGMLPLPDPVGGGDVYELGKFVNHGSNDDLRLIIACLLAWLRGEPEFPVLGLHGEQGSGKSGATTAVRFIIDPSALPTRAVPESRRDLAIAARK